jgi:hypothetical protein
MKKHLYSCSVSMGNMSIAETDMFKEAFENFMKSFRCKDFSIETIYEDESSKNSYYFYEANIQFRHSSFLKLQRFSESLISFSLFWGLSVREFALE